jgi:hypothetical protein
MLLFWLKDFEHPGKWHRNGFSPVCIFMWLLWKNKTLEGSWVKVSCPPLSCPLLPLWCAPLSSLPFPSFVVFSLVFPSPSFLCFVFFRLPSPPLPVVIYRSNCQLESKLLLHPSTLHACVRGRLRPFRPASFDNTTPTQTSRQDKTKQDKTRWDKAFYKITRQGDRGQERQRKKQNQRKKR